MEYSMRDSVGMVLATPEVGLRPNHILVWDFVVPNGIDDLRRELSIIWLRLRQSGPGRKDDRATAWAHSANACLAGQFGIRENERRRPKEVIENVMQWVDEDRRPAE